MIAVSSNGKSFYALAKYLTSGRSGEEHERVAWSADRNLPTGDPALAAKIMRATAAQSTRVELPVYHLTISFDPQDRDRITRAMMEQVADKVLARLGLAEHQAVYVSHKDREHPHVHIMVNRVHPETGRAWERWKDQPTIQRVLREQERELGLTVVPGRLAAVDGAPIPSRSVLTSGERRQAKRTGEPAFIERVRAHVADYRAARSWRDLEAVLAEDGLRLQRKGQGLVITDGACQVKASRVARDLSLKQLEAQFGVPYAAREQEAPVPPAVVRAARALRALDRWDDEAAVAYQARLTASREATRLGALEASHDRASRASADFDRALRVVYQDPVAARKAFEALASSIGREQAARQLAERPEQFGRLQREARVRALGVAVFKNDAQARAAAMRLPELAAQSAQVGTDATLRYHVAAVRASARHYERAHQETQAKRRHTLSKAVLRAAAAQAVLTLVPEEFVRLARLLTTPQRALLNEVRSTAREVLLGRQARERA